MLFCVINVDFFDYIFIYYNIGICFIVFKGNCDVNEWLSKIIHHCSKRYKKSDLNTNDYNSSWSYEIFAESNSRSDHLLIDPYTHRGSDSWMEFEGHLEYYPRSGYTALLANTRNSSVDILNELQQQQWLDEYTRVLFVEFSTLNLNLNLFTNVIISFEYLPTGGIIFKKDIQSINLYRYVAGTGLLNIVIEIATLLFGICITIKEIFNIKKKKTDYFSDKFNLMKIVIFVLFYSAVFLYIWRCLFSVWTVEDIKNKTGIF